MRSELQRLVNHDWQDVSGAYNVHIEAILALRPTPEERMEICQLLKQASDYILAMTWAGVMQKDPHPEYEVALKEALNNDDPEIVYHALWALVSGGYESGLTAVFSSERVLKAVGDRLPERVMGLGGRLTLDMRKKCLDLFCERFGEKTPQVDWNTECWFRLLSELDVTNDRAARILCRVWGELRPRDSDNKFLLLRAMAGAPHPDYEPIFRKAVKSRVEELRDYGTVGLELLSDECLD